MKPAAKVSFKELPETEVFDTEPSEQEVREYAEILGIDVANEPDLIWIAKQGILAPLPQDWKPVSWEHPSDEKYRQMVVEERKNLSLKFQLSKPKQQLKSLDNSASKQQTLFASPATSLSDKSGISAIAPKGGLGPLKPLGGGKLAPIGSATLQASAPAFGGSDGRKISPLSAPPKSASVTAKPLAPILKPSGQQEQGLQLQHPPSSVQQPPQGKGTTPFADRPKTARGAKTEPETTDVAKPQSQQAGGGVLMGGGSRFLKQPTPAPITASELSAVGVAKPSVAEVLVLNGGSKSGRVSGSLNYTESDSSSVSSTVEESPVRSKKDTGHATSLAVPFNLQGATGAIFGASDLEKSLSEEDESEEKTEHDLPPNRILQQTNQAAPLNKAASNVAPFGGQTQKGEGAAKASDRPANAAAPVNPQSLQQQNGTVKKIANPSDASEKATELEVARLVAERERRLSDLRAKMERDVRTLEQKTEEQKADLKAKADADLSQLKVKLSKEFEQASTSLKAENDQKLMRLKEQQETDLNQLQEKFNKQKAEASETSKRGSAVSSSDSDAAVRKLEETHKNELSELRAEHERQINKVRLETKDKCSKEFAKEKETLLAKQRSEIGSLQAELKKLREVSSSAGAAAKSIVANNPAPAQLSSQQSVSSEHSKGVDDQTARLEAQLKQLCDLADLLQKQLETVNAQGFSATHPNKSGKISAAASANISTGTKQQDAALRRQQLLSSVDSLLSDSGNSPSSTSTEDRLAKKKIDEIKSGGDAATAARNVFARSHPVQKELLAVAGKHNRVRSSRSKLLRSGSMDRLRPNLATLDQSSDDDFNLLERERLPLAKSVERSRMQHVYDSLHRLHSDLQSVGDRLSGQTQWSSAVDGSFRLYPRDPFDAMIERRWQNLFAGSRFSARATDSGVMPTVGSLLGGDTGYSSSMSMQTWNADNRATRGDVAEQLASLKSWLNNYKSTSSAVIAKQSGHPSNST